MSSGGGGRGRGNYGGGGGDRRGGRPPFSGRGRGRGDRGRGRGQGHPPPPADRRIDEGGGRDSRSRPSQEDRRERGRGRGSRPFGGDRGGRSRGGGRGRGSSERGERRPLAPKRYRREREEDNPNIYRDAQLEDVIVHSFFPRQLPDNLQDNLVNVEEKMLDLALASISDAIKSADGSFPKLKSSEDMLQTWKEIQPKWNSDLDEAKFMNLTKEKISSLTGKDQRTIPIYIRRQNCTLLIRKLSDQPESLLQLATFRASLPSELIMSTVGSLTVSYPETSDLIYNSELLTSDLFLRHIHQLSVDQFELALSTNKKGEEYYTDYRDVSEPFLVSDWIVGSLAPANIATEEPSSFSDSESDYSWLDSDSSNSEASETMQDSSKIRKKIRDQVVCQMSSRAVPFRRSGMWTSIKVALQLQLLHEFGRLEGYQMYKLIMLKLLSSICQQYCKERNNMMDLDLLSQMTAKLGRRALKLANSNNDGESTVTQMDTDDGKSPAASDKLSSFRESTLEFCKSVVESAQQQMNSLWKKTASLHPIIHPITRSEEYFLSDCAHEIEWLDQHIQPHITDITLKMRQIKLENLQKVEALKSSPDFVRSLKIHRYPDLEAILKSEKSFNSKYSELDEVNERIWLYDTESYIKSGRMEAELCPAADDPDNNNLSEKDKETKLKSLQELITSYFKNAVGHYVLLRDPAAFSQMLLVVLKLLQILDKVTTSKHPLLLKYDLGIKPELWERLILHHFDDMLLLREMMEYFEGRRKGASFPSIVEDSRLDDPNASSFPISFASQSEEMVRVRQKILDDTEAAIKAKLKDVKKVRKECEHLQMGLNALGGPCKMKGDELEVHDNQLGTRNYNSMTCRRCKLHRELDLKRRSVPTYERPLPPKEILQWEVVFELKIPPEIALLRDVLALLNWEMLGQPIFDGKQLSRARLNLRENKDDPSKSLPMEEWCDYMRRKGAGEEYKPTGGSSLNSVNLISPRIATSGTCNTKIMLLDVMTNPDEKFVVNNDLDCVYYHDKPLWFPIIKMADKICVFQLHSTNKPDSEIYGSLQWTVDSTKHTQNSVLSRRFHLCHKNLPIEEFTAFGSLRADGHRIQLRNLYRLMYDRGLSLDKEPVLALILQTIWQVGPINGKTGGMESHLDFSQENLQFSMQFLEMLEALVKASETNYTEPLVLLTVVILTTRILELNGDCECREKCRNLLRKCRGIVTTWGHKIQVKINALSKSKVDDEVGITYLKERLLEASLCSMFSFYVSNNDDQSLVKIVLDSKEDYVHWFHAISSFHQLTVEEQIHKGMSDFIQILLNSARSLPLKLKVEENLDIGFLKEPLHQFTSDKWSNAKDIPLESVVWKPLDKEKNKHVLLGAYEVPSEDEKLKAVKSRHFISLDLIRGAFLVNGFAQSTLPICILEHSLFRRYFKESKFRIQRYSTNARTIDKFHGRYYDFEITLRAKGKKKGDGEEMEMTHLAIREIGEKGTVRELLEPVLLRKFVGNPFVENYTHWLDHRTKTVQFRRLPKKDADYELPHDYTLYKDGSDKKKWKFYDERKKRHLLSINSEGFRQVTGALARLECNTEINLLFNGKEKDGEGEDKDEDKDKPLIIARLPRLRLNFHLVHGNLHSVEYGDFRIAANQNLGTLIGLQQGLLLEQSSSPDRYSKRILIVPHGYLETMLLYLKHHPSTTINLDKLRHPKFFVYEYDTVLRSLKGDKSEAAWLYLAALHGRTSSSLPDPFTKLTGTESAVGILTSGRVWPTQPYDEESLISLEMIRSLAPLRSYYGHGISVAPAAGDKRKGNEKMEITQWPEVIPSMAAFDGFPLIVDKLIENSDRLFQFYPKSKEEASSAAKENLRKRKADERITLESERLQLRSYLRYLPLYNQAAFVENEFIKVDTLDLSGTCGIGGKWKLHNMKLRDKSNSRILEGFGLRELLKIGQTRLVNSVENRGLTMWDKQVERQGLVQYFRNAEEVAVPPLYYKARPSTLEGLRLKDLLHFDFQLNWLQLYRWAASKEIAATHQFTLVLSAVAYRSNIPLEQAMHLHHISYLTSAHSVEFPTVPKFSRFTKAKEKAQVEGEDDDMEDSPEVIIPTNSVYKVNEIHPILEGSILPIPSSQKFDSLEEANQAAEQHLEKALVDCAQIAMKLETFWPCESISGEADEVKELFAQTSISKERALEGINPKLKLWYRNHQFNQLIEEVQRKLNEGLGTCLLDREKFQEELNRYGRYQFSHFPEVKSDVRIVMDGMVEPIDLEELMEAFPEEKLEECREIFETGKIPSSVEQEDDDPMDGEGDLKDALIQRREQYEEKIEKLMEALIKSVAKRASGSGDLGVVKEILNHSGITPRLTSGKLLEYLLPAYDHDVESLYESDFVTLVGALGVLWTHLKRLNRCIALQKCGISAASELQRELENPGHEAWSPKEYPEWLLLELELDIMIRSIQVKVARQMISMPDERNGVMQLNMGEGKTSVIVPMLCCALSGTDALCRVTVLKSIYKMNLGILKFAIGGLLNKRVYTVPCRRDFGIDLKAAEILKELLEEARYMKGVILTLPEYRLSFRLLAFDKILKGEHGLGGSLLQIENWLRRYCRDILDECDELLSFKYQLVYTTGDRRSIDGDELRWKICQSVLDSVRDISKTLLEDYGLTNVEYDWTEGDANSEQFRIMRLLGNEEEFLLDFKTLVADDQLKNWKGLEEHQKRLIRGFIVEEDISEEAHRTVMDYLEDKPELLVKVLLLSAYLKRGVLSLALSKRWRVEYGVNPTGAKAMAVPFRAKDCAAERTEFGHPDLAIVLTHLSYYYSGLEDGALLTVFEILKGRRDGETIYDRWMSQIPPEKLEEDSLRSFQRLNLRSDTEQRKVLFEVLSKHKGVIDFWLGNHVFPRESNQYPSKLTMTAWDLVWERQHHPVIGFSGTNGSKMLLPLPITQRDLDELEDTNVEMDEALKLPENDGHHRSFGVKVTCKEILKRMKEDSMKILIDAGALMLECDNEEVAELWLKVDPEVEAVVYFSRGDEILVKERREGGEEIKSRVVEDVPLELSPYRANLGKCAVFLDEQHTRGTDLKFPDGAKACVTVGTRMLRDKLMQACMRMRKLGRKQGGHSVAFYLSHEAYEKVRADGNLLKIGTEDVLNWTVKNTEEFNQNGLLYWAMGGRNYAQKLAAEDLFHYPNWNSQHSCTFLRGSSGGMMSETSLSILAKQCEDDDVTRLMDMYGLYGRKELLLELLPKWFESVKNKLKRKRREREGENEEWPEEILKEFEKIQDGVMARCNELPEKKVFSSSDTDVMEEEQEKEQEKEKEIEIEEEREKERPLPPEDAKPQLHSNVRAVALEGADVRKMPGIVGLSEIFRKTTFWKDVAKVGAWDKVEVYATKDFASVIVTRVGEKFATNDYLRPVEYLITCRKAGARTKILLLSPFEVNEMLPALRKGDGGNVKLHMFHRRRFQKQEILLDNRRLQIPSVSSSSRSDHVEVKSDSAELAALLVASGNLYFGNEREKESFARFLNLGEEVVEGDNAESMEVDDGGLTSGMKGVTVKKILACRHPVVSDVSDVVKFLDENCL